MEIKDRGAKAKLRDIGTVKNHIDEQSILKKLAQKPDLMKWHSSYLENVPAFSISSCSKWTFPWWLIVVVGSGSRLTKWPGPSVISVIQTIGLWVLNILEPENPLMGRGWLFTMNLYIYSCLWQPNLIDRKLGLLRSSNIAHAFFILYLAGYSSE